MNRKFASGFLFIFAIITSVFFFNASASAASTTLVLSQVDGGGGGSTGTYLFDYVEIKNISSSPQSLNGLSLYYGSAVGNFASTASNAFALPNVTLNPGQYYLVQLGPTGSAGAALPTPDVTTTNLTMSAASGKVALVNGASLPINTCGATATPCSAGQLAAIVDWVAYGAAGNGTAGNGEGGTSVNNNTAMTSTQGAVRKNGGCTDTDNNNLDFDVVTAPVPRNTSTTTPCSATPADAVLDLNGDGKTDFGVIRNVGGQLRWFYNLNGSGSTAAADWGVGGDTAVPEDYDGDGKDDIAVWRAGAPFNSFFYILQSQSNTVRVVTFGQTGDDPSVIGDYDGDGKADPAVYRAGASSVWYYLGSNNNPSGNITFVPWGTTGDKPAPGDYDGDGKNDFVIRRNDGSGRGQFWMNRTTAGVAVTLFGTINDLVVPGDYDGDGKTDLAVAQGISGVYNWFYLGSATSTITQIPFGSTATDFPVQGDYDGDGKADIAVWRDGVFWIRNSSNAAVQNFQLGASGDSIALRYNYHN
ncbi:MAG: VCBS repeat-containing protein [Acidobacteria bacterium]|nr:VCBS repeat-containing protein [Acidobacteriota bacterium]